jgi:hypothetical protein
MLITKFKKNEKSSKDRLNRLQMLNSVAKTIPYGKQKMQDTEEKRGKTEYTLIRTTRAGANSATLRCGSHSVFFLPAIPYLCLGTIAVES